jgi:integrase
VSRRGRGEGTLSRRTDGRWQARLRLEDGTRQSFYGHSRQEVARKLKEAVDARDKGTLVTSGVFPLAQWLDQWLADYVEGNKAPSTHRRYSEVVRTHLKPELGHVRLKDLSLSHVQRLYRRLREKRLAMATIDLVDVVLHQALEAARRARYVATNVVADATPPKVDEVDTAERAFTAEQIQVFCAAIVGHPYEQLWRLLLLTGLREGEALALRWSDVELQGTPPTLSVRRALKRVPGGYEFAAPKTRKGRRTLPLGRAAVETLGAQKIKARERQLRAPAWEDLDLVFPNVLGRPLREDRVLHEFKAVLRRAGLPERRVHDLRHTHATQLFRRGIHPKAVQELLGHSRIDITLDTYTGSVSGVLTEAVESLSDLLDGTGG